MLSILIVFLIVILFSCYTCFSLACSDGMGELQYYTGDVYRGSWKEGLRHGKVSIDSAYM